MDVKLRARVVYSPIFWLLFKGNIDHWTWCWSSKYLPIGMVILDSKPNPMGNVFERVTGESRSQAWVCPGDFVHVFCVYVIP